MTLVHLHQPPLSFERGRNIMLLGYRLPVAFSCLAPPSATTFYQKGFGNVGILTKPLSMISTKENKGQDHELLFHTPRIAIVGGGIAGLTAAHSLARRLEDRALIDVFEGDEPMSDQWIAATAKNANSLVPGAAMHVMSQRKTLWDIAWDTVKETFMVQREKFGRTVLGQAEKTDLDRFESPPPYFAFHPIRCMGPSATWDERKSFATFFYHFLKVSLLTGTQEANRRGEYMVQLSRANRFALLNDLGANNKLKKQMGLNQGFVSLHRTLASAQRAVSEANDAGEKAVLLERVKSEALDPSIAHLGQAVAGTDRFPLYGVHRLNDHSASCAVYVRDLINRCDSLGVQYNLDGVVKVQRSESKTPAFDITTAKGIVRSYDYLILAAGAETPLFAQSIGVGRCCPTYPLRGYSLTLRREQDDKNTRRQLTNMLNTPFSFDNMYFSSVGPNMVRAAGFGELVGYRDKAVDVPSVAPRILARYMNTIVPNAEISESQALQCFRPISPDDIPLVGAVKAVPGLFLHTGHGTLGWSTCLATAECVAQDVCDSILVHEENKHGDGSFELPDGTRIGRHVLSPDRFM